MPPKLLYSGTRGRLQKTTMGKQIHHIRFADDIVLMSEDFNEINFMLP